MSSGSDIERAKALAAEAIALCDEMGYDLPAAHLQMGLDLLPKTSPAVLREERAPWGLPAKAPKRGRSTGN